MIIGKKDKAYVKALEERIDTHREKWTEVNAKATMYERDYDKAMKRIAVLEQLVGELQLKAGYFIADVKDLCNEANGQLTKGGK